jgi:hypothetical protein
VIRPVLGERYVDGGFAVTVEEAFLAAVLER